MSRLQRRETARGHSYYLDGEKVPGVTTVLGVMAKDALVPWAAKKTAEFAAREWAGLDVIGADHIKAATRAHRDLRDEAARRGSAVHALVEPMVRGEQVAAPSELDLALLMHSARKFIVDWGFQALATEVVVWHDRLHYAGTFDLVGTSPHFPGRVFLADWKTSSGIYPKDALQLAAYGGATHWVDTQGEDRPVAELGVTDHIVVHLRTDGYTVHHAQRGPNPFAYFTAALRLYRWRQELDPGLLCGELVPNTEEVSA